MVALVAALRTGRFRCPARAHDRRLVAAEVALDDALVVTSWGVPMATTAPSSSATSRSEIAGDQRHVVLDHDQRGAGLVADVEQHRAERLGLALGDARRRLVEQQHVGVVRQRAGEVDDAAGAGRQLADELVGVGARRIRSMSASTCSSTPLRRA